MPIAKGVFDQHLLKLMQPVFTPLKNGIVDDIAGAMVLIEGENSPVTWVPIEEICSLEWSIGGPAQTTGAVPAFAAGKQ